MFKKARIVLTGWYLLSIMLISISFSIVIYEGLIFEVERFARVQRFRIEHGFRGDNIFNPGSSLPTASFVDLDLVAESKKRIIFILFFINGGILLLSGGFGYILAGKTLQPIQEMVDEQNRFISDASHELRTPLTSLKSAMEVSLRDKKLTLKEARILISESIDETNKLQQLSEELLELTQYQKPNGNLTMEKVNISHIVLTAIRKIKPLAEKKGITITNKVRDCEITVNKEGLTELFIILLDNAIKYSSAGSPISISSKNLTKTIYLSVQDKGIGIDKKDLSHIFDRFYRADSARVKSSSGGYGLGLSIAKKIVEVHKGTIRVESKLHKGSNFIVELPNK